MVNPFALRTRPNHRTLPHAAHRVKLPVLATRHPRRAERRLRCQSVGRPAYAQQAGGRRLGTTCRALARVTGPQPEHVRVYVKSHGVTPYRSRTFSTTFFATS